MSQGKIAAKVPRKKRDMLDVLMTIIGSGVPEAEIMKMTPRQRKEAREEWSRVLAAPGYRDWSAESSAMMRKYEVADFLKGARRPDWREYLISIDRLDLFLDMNAEHSYHCGQCHHACDALYCVKGQTRWFCKTCVGNQPAQNGTS